MVAMGNSYSAGFHDIMRASGSVFRTECDSAGWTLVMQDLDGTSTGDTQQNAIGAVGGHDNFETDTTGLVKISDADINSLKSTSDHQYIKWFCFEGSNSYERHWYRDSPLVFTTVPNAGGWKSDRNLDGTPDCDANRNGYIFGDYPDIQLSGATASCAIAGHANFGEGSVPGTIWGNSPGCYITVDGPGTGVGWGASMKLFVY